jgi:hypothetical protein
MHLCNTEIYQKRMEPQTLKAAYTQDKLSTTKVKLELTRYLTVVTTRKFGLLLQILASPATLSTTNLGSTFISLAQPQFLRPKRRNRVP